MTAPADHPIAPDGVPLLVGRERERAMLHDLLIAMLASRGSLVLIGGEAGIGKTALVEALGHEAEEQGALVLIGRCYDLTETPPYGPWVELFSRYQPTNGLPPLPVAFAERGAVGEVTSEAALFRQVQDFLSAIAASRPVILFLDDLHWADPASLDLLRFLARGLAAQPILVIATYRTDELTRRHPLYALLPVLVREASAARLDLRPLRPDDLEALVTHRYHLAASDAARLVAYLHERSEGNPFFLGELLRTLEEEGTLHTVDSVWHLTDLTRVRVPPLLRQVIDGRLARLGEEAQRLLAVAAVIGQEVPLALWAAVTGADEQALMTAVERAVDAHLLDETPDGTRARFVHALIREALYEGTLPSRRRMQHRQVAEARTALPDPDPDAVAYHFQQAGDARAVDWLVKAGERAQHAYAWATAAQRFETALALTPEERPSDHGWLLLRIVQLRRHTGDRRSLAYLDEAAALAEQAGDRSLAAWTRFGRGFLHSVGGQGTLAILELEAGAEALVALTPEERAWYPAGRPWVPANPPEAPFATAILTAAAYGWLSRATTLAQRWMEPYLSDEDTIEAAWRDGWSGLAMVHAAQGRPAAAREAYERAIRGARWIGHHFYAGAVLHALLTDVVLPYETEHRAERARLVREAMGALAIGREVASDDVTWAAVPEHFVSGAWGEAAFLMEREQNRLVTATMQGYVGRWHRERGNPDAAWACVRWALPDGARTEPGDAPLVTTMHGRLAAILALDAGDLDTAMEWLEWHNRWLDWSGAVLGQSEGQALWAQYHQAAGDPEAAYHSADQALIHATEPRQPLALLAAHRLLGELDTDAGRFDDAAPHLDTALGLADACAAPYERALTLLDLAELRAAMGQREEAQTALDEARTICIPLDAKPALVRAEKIAATLTRTKRPAVAYPAGLSAREVEVLRLVAAGLTDMQVADQLFLSPRTVGQHLRSIYNKLGVSSRTAASRFAVAHDLA